MARYTKTKRPTKKTSVKDDMQAAEEIQDGLEAFFEKLVVHKFWVIGAVAVLLIAIVGISVVSRQTASSREASGSAVAKVLSTYKAIPAEGDAEAIKAAVGSLVAAADPLILKHKGEAAALALNYVKASALLQSGDAAGAATILQSAAAEAAGSTLALPVSLTLARALKAKGDVAGAAQALNSAKTRSPLDELLVQKMLGDLYNPTFGEAKAGGDRAKAIAAYTKAVALVAGEGRTPKRGSIEEFYKNEIERRLSLLGAPKTASPVAGA